LRFHITVKFIYIANLSLLWICLPNPPVLLCCVWI